MSMLLRRRLMVQGGEPPAPPSGTYIYMKLNVPNEAFDTGIKLGDTNKAFTILTEMSFPNTTINGTNWTGIGLHAIYSLGSLASDQVQSAATIVAGRNLIRVRFCDKSALQYSNVENAPFLSPDRRHRFAHWHAADSGDASLNYDGYVTKTATGGTYVQTNDTLNIKSWTDTIVIHALYIYDKVLTEQEISDFISDGIIP